MTHALQLVAFWGAAFLTLAIAVGLLGVFYDWVGSDLGLGSLGKEAALAAFASLFEGVGLWLVFSVVHGAGRILIVPALIVYIIYRLDHLTDWSGHEPGVILLFQIVIGYCAVMLFGGHILAAVVGVLILAVGLAFVANAVKNLG